MMIGVRGRTRRIRGHNFWSDCRCALRGRQANEEVDMITRDRTASVDSIDITIVCELIGDRRASATGQTCEPSGLMGRRSCPVMGNGPAT
jgi:hypothetical protein